MQKLNILNPIGIDTELLRILLRCFECERSYPLSLDSEQKQYQQIKNFEEFFAQTAIFIIFL